MLYSVAEFLLQYKSVSFRMIMLMIEFIDFIAERFLDSLANAGMIIDSQEIRQTVREGALEGQRVEKTYRNLKLNFVKVRAHLRVTTSTVLTA